MKKVILGLFLVGLFSLCSCSQSPQEKAETFAKELMQKRLNDPSTYEPVETKFDSIYYSLIFDEDIPDELDKYENLCSELEGVEEDLNKLQKEKERTEQDISFQTDMYKIAYDEYTKSRLKSSKSSLNKINARHKELDSRKIALADSIESYKDFFKLRYDKAPEGYFYGWAIAHSYRIAMSNGNKTLMQVMFLTDKNMENLLVDEMFDNFNTDFIDKASLLKDILGVEYLVK